MKDHYGLIEAFVEGYRGSSDAPGFDACVRAEINERLDAAELKTHETIERCIRIFMSRGKHDSDETTAQRMRDEK